MDEVIKECSIDYSVIKNAIVLLGADHKVGTSIVSKMIGEKISENKDLKVLLICLDGTPGMDYIQANKNIKGIDDYKAKMSNHMLSSPDFANIHKEKEGLYFIKGSESIIKSRYYHPRDIYNFLNILSSLFDILIIDGGSNIELGMTIGALKVAKKVLLITDQKERSLERYLGIKSEITSKLNIEISNMVINKYINSRDFQDLEMLASNYQCQIIGEMYYSEYGIYTELERSTLLSFKDNRLIDSLDNITHFIEEILSIDRITEKREKMKGIKKYLVEKGWIQFGR